MAAIRLQLSRALRYYQSSFVFFYCATSLHLCNGQQQDVNNKVVDTRYYSGCANISVNNVSQHNKYNVSSTV